MIYGGGGKPGPVNIARGKVVGDQWRVLKKLGAGGCGAVYLVEDVNRPDTPHNKAALKAESNFVHGGSVLKVEVDILERLKGREHVAQLLHSAKRERFQYMVMTLLGECLGDLLKRIGKTSVSTQIRVGLHVLHGLKMIHDIGFVHRDIKPANLAIGAAGTPEVRYIHILDFGLARDFVVRDAETGLPRMRRPRKRALFRGTTRYCSISTHDRIEQGRCDDLWSLLYVMAEAREDLPWKKIRDKNEVADVKRNTPDAVLLSSSPENLLKFAEHLRTLTYFSRPDYVLLFKLLNDVIEGLPNVEMADPWDWEKKIFGGMRRKTSQEKPEVATTPKEGTTQDDDEVVKKGSMCFPEADFTTCPFPF